MTSIDPAHRASRPAHASRPLGPGPARARDLEAAFRLLLASNPVPMWIYDLASLRILEVNDAATAQYGYPREAFLALRITDLRPPDDVPRLLEDLGRPRPSLQASGEWRHRLADGRLVDVDVVSHTLEFGGRPAVLVAAHDVTERRRTETALRESEERYRLAAETVSDAIVSTDERGRVVFANSATEPIFGWPADRLVGKPVSMLMPARLRDAHRRGFRRYVRTGHRQRSWRAYRSVALHRDGHEFPIDVSLGETVTDAGRRFTSFMRDISGQQRLEEQIRQLQKMESIGQLAGGIAHDFNNLLTAIRGYADLLAGELGRDDPRQEGVRGILDATNRAAELTGKLLTFSRREVPQPDVLDLSAVVDGVRPLLARVLGEHIELRTDLRATGRVRADRGQLELVAINLAVNASDAMPDGGRLTFETADVEIDAAFADEHPGIEPGPHVLLAVTDTGVGMDAETRARVFEPFFTTKPEGKGTGLGLATVYGIVRGAGGAIWVYSEAGTGSSFKIHLPRVETAAAAAESAPAMPPVEPHRSARPHETVVLVEDDMAVRTLAAGALRRLGYDVRDYGDPVAASADLEQPVAPVDLVVTDVMMPGMTGRELARRARLARPGLPVLFVSGFSPDTAGTAGARDGDFLPKPFAVSELARRVRVILDQGR